MKEKENLSSKPVFLSDTELFYTEKVNEKSAEISGEEANHLINVMRNKVGDLINLTDGKGKIYKAKLIKIQKNTAWAVVVEFVEYQKSNENIRVFVPNLKSKDRMRFLIEKLVEIGILNITIFDSKRSIAKGGNNEKWEKITIAAIKQSLRAFLPNVYFEKSLAKIDFSNQIVLIFDQNAETHLSEIVFENDKNYSLIFGPEGGLDESEMNLHNSAKIKLSNFRLRSETAVIFAVSKIIKL